MKAGMVSLYFSRLRLFCTSVTPETSYEGFPVLIVCIPIPE